MVKTGAIGLSRCKVSCPSGVTGPDVFGHIVGFHCPISISAGVIPVVVLTVVWYFNKKNWPKPSRISF